MALELYIPPCIDQPAHPLHLPHLERPLRINIEGPLVSIQKLLPDIEWILENSKPMFPQPAGPALAQLTYETIYQRAFDPEESNEVKVRDEYMGWIVELYPKQ
jgi:hypothetical protein